MGRAGRRDTHAWRSRPPAMSGDVGGMVVALQERCCGAGSGRSNAAIESASPKAVAVSGWRSDHAIPAHRDRIRHEQRTNSRAREHHPDTATRWPSSDSAPVQRDACLGTFKSSGCGRLPRYRGGALLAATRGDTRFVDDDALPGQAYLYSVVARSSNDDRSEPAYLKVFTERASIAAGRVSGLFSVTLRLGFSRWLLDVRARCRSGMGGRSEMSDWPVRCRLDVP